MNRASVRDKSDFLHRVKPAPEKPGSLASGRSGEEKKEPEGRRAQGCISRFPAGGGGKGLCACVHSNGLGWVTSALWGWGVSLVWLPAR